MPGIRVPEILKPLDLGGYDQSLQGQVIEVWVNPTRRLILQHVELMERKNRVNSPEEIEAYLAELYGWYAEIWSHGSEGWTAEDVETLIRQTQDTDPQLWTYLANETVRLIGEHRSGKKKD